MKTLTALLAGVLFGSGLLISGMTNPAIVLGFLDVSGGWNPALALVMAGAIAVSAPAFYFVRRHQHTWRGEPASLPGRTRIDAPLVVGSTIFGVGWGLSGICPGPGLILLTGGTLQALVFVVAMAGGMVAARLVREFMTTRTTAPTAAE